MNHQDIEPLVALLRAGHHRDLEREVHAAIEREPQRGILWQLLAASLAAQDKDALHASEKAAQLLPDDAIALNNFANALARSGNLNASVSHYRRAIEIRPDFAEAYNNLGRSLIDLQRPQEALSPLARALVLRSDYPEAFDNHGSALLAIGRLTEAAESFQKAIALEPGFLQAHHNLGSALLLMGRLADAEKRYRHMLSIDSGVADVHRDLGTALRLQGRTAEAQASCRLALQLNPRSASTWCVLAEANVDAGDFQQAEDCFQHAIAVDPQSPDAWAGLVRLRKMTPADGTWLRSAQALIEQPLPPKQAMTLHYALGKYHDDTKDFKRAFSHFERANRLAQQCRPPHDQPRLAATVDRIIADFDQHWLAQQGAWASDSPRPIFIVGMMRSGTTLMEQIIASHPAAAGAGELTFWSDAARDYAHLCSDGKSRANFLPRMVRGYEALLRHVAHDKSRVVDKMPTNFAYLGLIHAAFPRARILHMVRHPLDNCLSIYTQQLDLNATYANDLEDLAHYYTQYQRLMSHWASILPSDAVLHVPYEALVGEPAKWCRAILHFVGLSWDPVCLEFHKSSRSIVTASKWQIRQRLNNRSIGRWQNYREFLAPLQTLPCGDR